MSECNISGISVLQEYESPRAVAGLDSQVPPPSNACSQNGTSSNSQSVNVNYSRSALKGPNTSVKKSASFVTFVSEKMKMSQMC